MDTEKPNPSSSGRRLSGWLRELHIKDTIAKDGGQAFAGVNFGTINYASPNKSDLSATEKIKKCQDALYLTDARDDRAELVSVKGSRVQHTCEWIKENDMYKSWLCGQRNLVWISGGPGKGKTLLSIFLTEELENAITDNSHVVYYFCSHQDEKRNNAVQIIRGLLWQITRIAQLRDLVLQHFSAQEKNNRTLLSSSESLWRLFAAIVTDPAMGTFYCLLDGLDECDYESTNWLVKKLGDLFSADNTGLTTVRLVIVSRDLPSIAALVTRTKCGRVNLDSDHEDQIKSDIERVASANVKRFSWMDGYSPRFEEEVHKILLERSEGTFLWVGCVVNELEKETTCSGVLQKLRTFPKSLNAIYGRMLLQIEESDRRLQTSLILRWVALAVSPLTLEELAAAIQTQPFTTIDAEPTGDQVVVIGAQQVIRDQIKMCGSLLQLHGETVVLVHKSAREFLLRKEADDSTILEEFRIRPAEAHMLIALTCLECIKRSPLRERALSPDNSATWQESPLLRYAVIHWQEHAKLSVDQGVALFSSPSFLFEKNAQIRDNWWQTFEACVGGQGKEWGRPITLRRDEEKLGDILRGIELKIQRQLNEKTIPPLHMACRLGLVEWARTILKATKHQRNLPKVISALDENGLNPLTWAAMEGHVDVVGLLLDYQADINATTSLIKRTGLSIIPSRSLNSYIREVTDGDSIWTGKHTVLYRAAFRGHSAVVNLLLERGADPNLKGWAGLTPLHAAAMAGREEVVRLLLENGGSKTVNAKLSVTHITPLQYSAEADNYKIANMLLESGADVQSKQTHSRYTALHCAVAEDAKTQIVQLMIDHGVDVMSKTMWMDTPLHLAAELSRRSTIKLLVERGAVIDNKHSLNGNTALHVAAKTQSRSENVEMLLDLGADIHAKNSTGKTALHLAVEALDAETVRVLLDRGAEPNAKCQNGDCPLHCATRSANAMIVQLLLDRASDVNALNNDGQTALDIATSSKVTDSEDMKELLISMGGISGQQNKARRMKQVDPSRLSVISKLNRNFASSTSSSISGEVQRTNLQAGATSLKEPVQLI